ncbi:S-layer homology domain-containing protein [Cohnella boryungensis]|uniref:S-layer homology domain-containing protein n=1 Tax=Cohnella boryungensis TaxID=768479 RepID=A0ABV8S836_9BACL
MSRWNKLGLSLVLLLGCFPFLPERTASASDYVVAPQIAMGYYHSLSLLSDGTVYSWGQNTKGQLGDGTTGGRKVPTKVADLSRVKAVATGIRSSYAMQEDGTLWAWGMNENGQLGDGTSTNRTKPVLIAGISGVRAISTGVSYHTLALTDDGKVWAWGKNDSGELGDGTTIQRDTPVQVSGLTDVVAIAAGGWHSMALKSDGTVWTWGNNEFGELGDGSLVNRSVPHQIAISEVTAISAGNSHSLAVKADGTVWSWGMNTWGMLGDGTSSNRSLPVQTIGVGDVKAVSGGGHHSYALTNQGDVWAWGFNNYGEMGDGTLITRYAPINITALKDIAAIAAGGFSGTAMETDGTVWGWGSNGSGELGDNTTETRLIPVINRAVLDLTPPTVGDPQLIASNVTQSQAMLSWTKASDNLSKPEELEYRVYRVGSNNPSTVSAIESSGTPIGPYEADISEKLATGLYGGQSYHFIVIVKDKAGRKSAYAKLKVNTPEEPTYTIWYEGNGNTSGEPPLDPYEYWENEQAEVLGNTGGLGRAGFSFAGWNAQANGLGMDYQPGDEFLMPAGNVTLYAKWLRDPGTFPPSGDATLSGLILAAAGGQAVALNPSFDRSTVSYSVNVAYGTSSVSVTAATYDPRASVTASVYGRAGTLKLGPLPLMSGAASAQLPLDEGSNRIELNVAAEDGTGERYTISLVRANAPSSGSSDPVQPQQPVTQEEPKTAGLASASVNGQSLQGFLSERRTAEGDTIVMLDRNTESLLARLEREADRFTLRLETGEAAGGRIQLELTGEIVRALENKEANVELRTSLGSYRLPAEEIRILRLSELLEGQNALADITVRLSIAQRANETIAGAKLIAPLIEFSIHADFRGRSVEAARFSTYVERTIRLPEGTDARRVTTAVVVEKDGSLRHVPSRTEIREGKPVAVIHSLTNSVYALISNPVSFADLTGHWAQAEVEDLASRRILNGVDSVRYEPAAPITRAEFAAIIVRALGLSPSEGAGAFADVKPDAWYRAAVATATEYEIVKGNREGTFLPGHTITREEAAVMLARAMKMTGIGVSESLSALDDYEDGKSISPWAQGEVAAAVKGGLLKGVQGGLKPQALITRAETAVMVSRLLQQAGFISVD